MGPAKVDRPLRLFSEFVVIVVGVLTALGVDQLMESRTERLMERELLESLVEDLRLDSADFASLPQLALSRAWGAEVILREFAAGSPRGIRVEEQLEGLGPYPEVATDRQLIRAFAAVGVATDLDVASEAYSEFSGAGGQRLVRNQALRRSIHQYYSTVQSNLKYDPRVREGMWDHESRALDLGLSHGDNQADLLRRRLSAAGPGFFASLRRVQQDAIVQSDIARLLLGRVLMLIEEVGAELAGVEVQAAS